MTKPVSTICAAVALCVGLSFVPAAQAADGDAMMHKDTMMHKGTKKKSMKPKSSMMGSGHMGSDAMKKDDTPPQQ